ncbi:calcium-binding protein [Pyrus ussuriensis x Pyrus communis]|uniref:Calcium-binding protein n=1 Tax=Pyrus ussuriensis x Pyrus communis TaxID=2448454 RepID=A0A5N5F1A6_9ROSA|nr:calcium-binding protein [Pyrus ussuriensis x Pyrus communis]
MAMQQRIWNPTGSEQKDESGSDRDGDSKGIQEQTIGFSVKNAVLFPPEVEKGTWPEDYSFSDHARLTVVFSPIRTLLSDDSLTISSSAVLE